MSRELWIALALYAALTGCLGDREQPMDPNIALERLREAVEASTRLIARDGTATTETEYSPTACFTSAGGVSGLFSLPYGKRFVRTVGVQEGVEVIRRFWEERGYTVSVDNPDSDTPTVQAQFDGFVLAYDSSQRIQQARIGGSTPCVRMPSGDANGGA